VCGGRPFVYKSDEALLLPAGRGGEGKEDSRLVLCGSDRRRSQCPIGSSRVLLFLLAGLGGKVEDDDFLELLIRRCWWLGENQVFCLTLADLNRWRLAASSGHQLGPNMIIFELVLTDAFIASTILYRQGGETSTSMTEAIPWHCCGCSSSFRCEVIHSPHWNEGPRWLSVIRRALPSRRPPAPRRHCLEDATKG
jgi:hypothetical protein